MKTRITLIISILILLSLACSTASEMARENNNRIMKTAISQAIEPGIKPGDMSDGDAYAMLVGAYALEQVAPELLAIEYNLSALPGALTYIQNTDRYVVMLATAGKVNGQPVWFVAAMNSWNATLVDFGQIMDEYSVDWRAFNSLDDILAGLKKAGFTKTDPQWLSIYPVLKMAMSFVAHLGGAAVDIFLVPAEGLSPEQMIPYCRDEIECIGISQ